MLRERAHSERFRGVVSAVDDDNPRLDRLDGGMVRSFPDDQRVDAALTGLVERIRVRAGASDDGPAARAPAALHRGRHSRRAELSGKRAHTLDELGRRKITATRDTDLHAPIP